MTTEEAKKRLAVLATNIKKLIAEYESASGLEIDDITLRRAPTIGANSAVYNIELTAKARANYGL